MALAFPDMRVPRVSRTREDVVARDSSPDADGFTLVRRGRKARRRECRARGRGGVDAEDGGVDIALDQVEQELQAARHGMRMCQGPRDAAELVLSSGKPPRRIVCLGLGRLASEFRTLRATSQHQLVFLEQLCELLNVSASHTIVYEPLASAEERGFLRRYGWTVPNQNAHGRYPVDEPTLFVMLHCPSVLYDNVLAANWTAAQLERVIVLGNSFSQYVDASASQLPHVLAAAHAGFVHERRFLVADGPWRDAFSSSSIHSFDPPSVLPEPRSIVL